MNLHNERKYYSKIFSSAIFRMNSSQDIITNLQWFYSPQHCYYWVSNFLIFLPHKAIEIKSRLTFYLGENSYDIIF